jgi:hypothetical protein
MQPDMGGLWRMDKLRQLREAALAPERRRLRRCDRRREAPPPGGGANREIDLTGRTDDEVAVPEDEPSAQPYDAGSPVSLRTSWATAKARLAAGTPA